MSEWKKFDILLMVDMFDFVLSTLPASPSWPAVAPFREPNVTPQVIVKSEPLRTRPRGGVRGGFYDLIEEISGITDLSNISENVGFSLWFDEFLLCPYNIVLTGS